MKTYVDRHIAHLGTRLRVMALFYRLETFQMGKVHKEIAKFMVNGAKGDHSNEQLVTV